jgi:hypothetical protein
VRHLTDVDLAVAYCAVWMHSNHAVDVSKCDASSYNYDSVPIDSCSCMTLPETVSKICVSEPKISFPEYLHLKTLYIKTHDVT